MKYCFNCNHITAGEPLFCGSCGRTYRVKLCPRLHVNPRSAEVCSQCGSRDLSTPQPKVQFWVPILEFLLSMVPGFILAVFSIAALALVIQHVLRNPQFLFAFFMLACALGVLWWMWSQTPHWFRSAVYRMLKRKREENGRGGRH
jgi:hypothetical protein